MELLEGDKTFDFVRDEIVLYEDSLDNLRNKKAILKSELNKIQALIGDNYIDEDEVIDLYNKLKAGLGDNIGKELKDVLGFKKKLMISNVFLLMHAKTLFYLILKRSRRLFLKYQLS